MNKAAFRVGLFAIVGVAVLALALMIVGGRWLAATERGQLRYTSSIYGLQEGAPVVFRGVRIGQVTAVRLTPKDAVVGVQLERERLVQLLPSDPGGALLPVLVEGGLVARLATQSLLTGLLYIDLELDRPTPRSASYAASTPPQIPTAPNTLQTIKAQLDQVNMGQIAEDLAAVAAGTRKLVGNPQIPLTITRIGEAAQAVQQLAQQMQRSLPPLTASGTDALARVGQAADRVNAAAARMQDVAGEASPLLTSLRSTSDELARAATALGQAASSDSSLRVNADRALQDVARAARTLRELGDTLERHPDALLRGRQAEPEPVP